MTISDAFTIIGQAGIGICNNRASFSSSRRGIHGAPTYRVYMPGATEPQIMKLNQVRQLALSLLG
jgi:hypothetical protein